MAELHELSLTEAAELLQRREASPVALTRALLERIEKLDLHLHAYVCVTAESALAQARDAERELAAGRVRGPLHGVPIALKDLIATRDAPTRVGTIALGDWSPGIDAEVTRRLREGGAVLLGKLALTEGAYAEHHPRLAAPVHPWRADLWTGVSSSGSGVATAARLCMGSLGTDTGGSIRLPSLACGITGLKPTYGRVSRRGAFPLAESLDHIGPMARSAQDAAAILRVIAGPDPHDPTSLSAAVPDYPAEIERGVRDLRVGFDESYCSQGLDPLLARALRDACQILHAAGARIEPVRVPSSSEIASRWIHLCAAEAALAHEATYPKRAADYGPALAQLLELGRRGSALDHARAGIARLRFAAELTRLFETVDLLVAPTGSWTSLTLAELAALPPREAAGVIRCTAPYNASGSPTLSLPAGLDTRGAPFGFQLVGRHLGEAELLRAGHAIQKATDWHRAVPPDPGS